MSYVELQKVTKRFRSVTALSEVSFDIQEGEFFVMLGPTGAGKTTTLRVIAGLEKHEEGHVLFQGQIIDGFTPADRDVAFVFQQYSLYPTMSVYDNLAFPLRSPLRNWDEEKIKLRVQDAAETLRITHLLDRKTANLSGGEMQRVTIGRAIVRDPRLFLMDEPLSNLDAKLREVLRVELQHLQKTHGSTTLFVTHDQIEALTMADRIAVLNEGKILQIGTPNDIYDRPATTFVATLVGTPRINLLQSSRENGKLHIDQSDIHLPLPGELDLPETLLLGIRPEDVDLTPNGEFGGDVVLAEPLGVETILHVRTGEQTLVSIDTGVTELREGTPVNFNIVRERLHYFDQAGKRLV